MSGRLRQRLGAGLFVAWILALLLVPLGRRVPWAAALVLVLLVVLTLSLLRERRRRRLRGWWVEVLGPGQLRGGPDEIAVVYHEPPNSVGFDGTRGGGGARDRLVVPAEASWDERVGPWARGRRAEIVAHLLEDPIVRRRIELVDG